ncbi:MAG: hypothetical protein U1E17_06565 [Geminicoccaceae bacterium]
MPSRSQGSSRSTRKPGRVVLASASTSSKSRATTPLTGHQRIFGTCTVWTTRRPSTTVSTRWVS